MVNLDDFPWDLMGFFMGSVGDSMGFCYGILM
jgi:hypothetical protein